MLLLSVYAAAVLCHRPERNGKQDPPVLHRMDGGGNLTDVTVSPDPALPPGTAVLPYPEQPNRLRLGTAMVQPATVEHGDPGQIRLSPDLWQQLRVPYADIRLQARLDDTGGELELGPVVAALYMGKPQHYTQPWRERVADLYYAPFSRGPGLYALAFDEAVDWENGTMRGAVVDNRPRSGGSVIEAVFPIPAALRLAWRIRKEVIDELRERTGNRVLNWIRSIGKWQFWRILSADQGLKEHLPDTRLLRSAADVSAMLTRYGTVFLKHVHGTLGRRSMRARLLDDGLEVSYLDRTKRVQRRLPPDGIDQLMELTRQVLGEGRSIVQQGIDANGRAQRPLHFRVLLVREPDGSWRCAALTAHVAYMPNMVYTNYGITSGAQNSLQRHYGMGPDQAAACTAEMVSLCCQGAGLLAAELDPLGILGFDVLVEGGTGRLWLLEANAVPAWEYSGTVTRDIATSQIAYALSLTGFGSTDHGGR